MVLKMKELPTSERPYEKLEIYGTKKLSNSELLAIIIKTGTKDDTAISLAQKVLNLNKEKNINNLRFLQNISIDELCQIKGIGKIKAIQIIAMRRNCQKNDDSHKYRKFKNKKLPRYSRFTNGRTKIRKKGNCKVNTFKLQKCNTKDYRLILWRDKLCNARTERCII